MFTTHVKDTSTCLLFLVAHILRDPRRYFKTDLDPRALVANYVASGLIILLPLLKNKPRGKNKTRKPIDKIVIDMARLVTQQIRLVAP